MGPSSGPSSPPAGNALGIHNSHGAHPHLHRSLSSTAGHESPSNKYSGALNHLAVHGTANIPRSKHAFETDLDLGVLIDDCPMGEAFSDIPVDDDEIKKLKKKVRPYYENMSRIREQYVEVDQLLSSALPSSIVTSFQPTNSGFDRMGDTDLETGRSYGTAQSAGSKREKRNSPRSERENASGHLDAREEDPLLASSQAKEEKREKQNRLALNVNFAVNIALLLGKGLAVLSSSSVSLVASFVDSFLDFVSTLIIFLSSVAMGRKGDRHKYPAGKKRFEPLGVLVFSVTMIASFVQVFIESFQRALATREGEGEVAELSWLGIGTMIATIVIKGIIWVWCAHMPSTAIRALAQDAENDVFFNIMSLGFPWLGGLLHWKLLDPIGGMILSGYIIWQWCQTLHENFTNLSGRAAEGHEVTRILYLVSRFKPVLQISYCEIYHLGDEIVAEIDVVLPQKSSLHYAHDVTETLQGLIESLEGVARAYVHADYSSENPAQHQVAETRHDVRRKSIVSPTSSEEE